MLDKHAAGTKSKNQRSDVDRSRGRSQELYAEIEASGLFDGDFYLNANPDVASAGLEPLDHYIRCGWLEGRKPSKLFDPADYRKANPNIKDIDDPFLHYVRKGHLIGCPRSPI